MCDIRYAEKRSFYEFSNRRFGIPLLNEGPERLAKLIGHSKAIDFLFMDKQINSQEAIDLGIVNEIVQDGTGTVAFNPFIIFQYFLIQRL